MELHEKFSVLITTKNRISHLKKTLYSLNPILQMGVKVIICDDGSKDNTPLWIRQNYPEVELFTNDLSQGYIKNRNELLALVRTPFAISLDDDASIISQDPLDHLVRYFENNPRCGLVALRIFWGSSPPKNTHSTDSPQRVRSFVGCGHVWRMEAWKSIPDYPSWYNFYGEEDFASLHLLKRNWEVHYLPEILVHHRADLKARKKEKDYIPRLRSSLRAGWNNYFIFYPAKFLPRRLAYSVWIQLKRKVFKGEIKVCLAILKAIIDLFGNSFILIKSRCPLSKDELRTFTSLPDTKYYWIPGNEKDIKKNLQSGYTGFLEKRFNP